MLLCPYDLNTFHIVVLNLQLYVVVKPVLNMLNVKIKFANVKTVTTVTVTTNVNVSTYLFLDIHRYNLFFEMQMWWFIYV